MYSASKKMNLHFYSSRMQMRIFFAAAATLVDDYNPFMTNQKKDHRKGKQKIGENFLISFPSWK